MLTPVRVFARCLLTRTGRQAQRDRVQVVALQHPPGADDRIGMHPFDLLGGKSARGHEHGWIEGPARDVRTVQVEGV